MLSNCNKIKYNHSTEHNMQVTVNKYYYSHKLLFISFENVTTEQMYRYTCDNLQCVSRRKNNVLQTNGKQLKKKR